MWRRPVVTILMLVIALILTPPMRAQRKNVAPTLRSAQKRATGILPVKGHGQDGHGTSMSADLKVSATMPGTSSAKPFTQEQVVSMVRDGFGDESGAKLIEQRGIDFAPSEDFYQTLKAAGASEAFLNALRAAQPPEPASAKKPLNQVQVFALLVGQVPSHRVAMLVQERGTDFEPTDDYLQEVRLAGGEDELISALKSAKVTKPATFDSEVQARLSEIRQHVARGAELKQKGQYALAEQEYRAALALDSQNDDVYVSLASVLGQQQKWDDTAQAAREALRLNPNNDLAHNNLGVALGNKGDPDGAMTEYREALRLNPNNDTAHANLGTALGNKGDWDGEITEEREALRLNPNNALAHTDLGLALGNKGDWDGEITEEREALRLNPDDAMAHNNLGFALGNKGDNDGMIAEEREALRLNPNNDVGHANLGVGLGNKGDWDGEITEEREALRLNPKNDKAHANLGAALGGKGDWDGEIAEEREALRLNPKNDNARVGLGTALANKGDWDGLITEAREALRLNPDNDMAHVGLGLALGNKGDNDGMIAEEREALHLNPNNGLAHASLGAALEKKGDRQGALDEYRAACTLDPKNAQFKQAYDRLSQPSSPVAEATPTDISGEWKSLTSGATFRVRLEQGHAYVERVVTEDQSKLGIFQLCDLGNEGDKYEGTCRSQWVARWYDRWHYQWRTRTCLFEGQWEFTKYSHSRIEGRSEARGRGERWSDKDNSNCGERFPVVWTDFVWIRPN